MDQVSQIEVMQKRVFELQEQLKQAHAEIMRLKMLLNGENIMKNSLGPNYRPD